MNAGRSIRPPSRPAPAPGWDLDPRRELLDYLDAHVGYTPHQKARQLLERGELSWSQDTTVTLYDDEAVTVVGNPRRSFGYLYVGAWFKADLPGDEPPPS